MPSPHFITIMMCAGLCCRQGNGLAAACFRHMVDDALPHQVEPQIPAPEIRPANDFSCETRRWRPRPFRPRDASQSYQ